MSLPPIKNRILRLKTVMNVVGLSRSTIYEHMDAGIFPKSVKLGQRSVGWLESEILDWIAQHAAARG